MPKNILSDQEEKIARQVLRQIFQDDTNTESYISTANAIVAGKTIGQGLGLKESDLDVILGLAAGCYMAARYEQAAQLYSFAALLDHFDARAMQGAGMALQKLGRHAAALQYFAAILLQEPENSQIMVQLAESMAMSGNKQEALGLLRKIAESRTDEKKPDHKNYVSDRASALISLITNDLASEHN